jgi:hypothetical protein
LCDTIPSAEKKKPQATCSGPVGWFGQEIKILSGSTS